MIHPFMSRYLHCFAVALILLMFAAVCFPIRKAISLPANSYVFPVVYPRLSSSFGMRKHPIWKVSRHHSGIDLAAPIGSFVRAISSGLVIFSDPHGGYGNLIVIAHKNGITSHYGHLEKMRVNPGDRVVAGQIIGTVGTTGHSTGPHLHFEIRKSGKPLNPVKYMPGITGKAEG
jgi:murein DD-endopeptidase MepM/ murein hydrolase activator NlpD